MSKEEIEIIEHEIMINLGASQCGLTSSSEKELWFKAAKAQEKLLHQYQQFKKRYRIRSKAYNKVLLENASLKDKVDLYKEVIEEVREYIKDACYYYDLENYSSMTSSEVKELLQILDKVKEK